MLKIGEFSKLSRVSIRMLRRYNEVGLLLPAETDPITGYRYYSEDQLPAAGRITALRDMGFGLAAIEQLLATWEEPVALEAILDAKQAQLQEEAALAQRRLRALETLRQRLRKEDNAMDYTVNLKTLPQRQAACLRMTIPTYDQEGTLWQILMQETAHLNLQPDDPCYCSVTFHDGEFKERDIDVEAQKTVRGQYPDTEHVQFKQLPPVTFASTVYQGPYEKIGEANAAVAAWVRDNGYTYDGRYTAFPDGRVAPGRGNAARDMERVGKGVADGTRDLVNGVGDVVRDAGNGLRDAGQAVKNAADRDM